MLPKLGWLQIHQLVLFYELHILRVEIILKESTHHFILRVKVRRFLFFVRLLQLKQLPLLGLLVLLITVVKSDTPQQEFEMNEFIRVVAVVIVQKRVVHLLKEGTVGIAILTAQ